MSKRHANNLTTCFCVTSL